MLASIYRNLLAVYIYISIYIYIYIFKNCFPGGRTVFMHGPKGPGPRAANFQGGILKKIEIEI
jgi:hypothetical protein